MHPPGTDGRLTSAKGTATPEIRLKADGLLLRPWERDDIVAMAESLPATGHDRLGGMRR
jgi:hypothetical protein